MPIIDLTRYIVASSGTWTDPEDDPCSTSTGRTRWRPSVCCCAGPATSSRSPARS